MKKTLLGGITALSLIAFLASGCARETVESKSDKQIKFTTVVGKQTRAEEFTYWDIGQNISVHSFPAGSAAPFRHFNLIYNGGGPLNWTYNPPVPHPGVPLVFFSIYPEQNVTIDNLSGKATDISSFTYNVPTDDLSQVDLLAAHVPATSETLVGLEFAHLLTQVNFGIRGLMGIQYEVTDIELVGVAESGTYTFPIGAGFHGWSNLTISSDPFPYRPKDDLSITPGDTDDILFLGNHPAYNGNPAVNDNENALMLLPQNLSGVELNFNYAIYDAVGDVLVPNSPLSIQLEGLNGVWGWAPSMRYVYVIDFTGEDIAFSVDVMPWEDMFGDDGTGLINVKPD